VETSGVFISLAGILGLAAAGGVVARLLRQPPLLGYVLAGIGISIFGGTGIENPQMKVIIEVLGRFGITLLLFLAGLELPLSELKRMGKVSLVAGVGKIIITSAVGFGLARIMGFSGVEAMYLGVATSFASTILVVKLLSEKGDLQSLSGKIAVGYLLVQDFVIIGLMVVLSGWVDGTLTMRSFIEVIIKGGLMVTAAVWLSGKVMAGVLDYLAKSTELLFITSIGWCLVVAAIVASPILGFSVEIGGFLAGLTMANVAEQAQIISRVRPLRDFFLTWFFVALGANVVWTGMTALVVPAVILSLLVVVGGPVAVMMILGNLGYRKRTYFMASLAVAQISEFSLVMVTNAVRTGLVPERVLTLVTLVGILTMTCSTYLLWNSHWLYTKLAGFIGIWEKKKFLNHEEKTEKVNNHVILFGHNRVGSRILPALKKMGKDVVVVDFNPEIVEKLKEEGIGVIYGDMSDCELHDRLNLGKAAVVISTVPDANDGLQLLLSLAESKKPGRLVIMTANDVSEAEKLYKAGADYVLLPHSVGGEFLAHIIDHFGKDGKVESLKDYFMNKKSAEKAALSV
jgi:Kef-type K+ transport system membrane component KefB